MHPSISPRSQYFEDGTFAGRRVLVVEDDFLVSLVTTDLLESVGCVVVGPAAHLTAALQLARLDPLDAAVLDIDIAGQAIWPVAEELQRRHVPFLFLSAHHQQTAVPVLFATAPHMEKPLQQNRVLHALSAMWGH